MELNMYLVPKLPEGCSMDDECDDPYMKELKKECARLEHKAENPDRWLCKGRPYMEPVEKEKNNE